MFDGLGLPSAWPPFYFDRFFRGVFRALHQYSMMPGTGPSDSENQPPIVGVRRVCFISFFLSSLRRASSFLLSPLWYRSVVQREHTLVLWFFFFRLVGLS